jgi:hypothetical protein
VEGDFSKINCTKSVAQAIPAHYISLLLLPETLGEDLERMINLFWWGSIKASGRGLNWLRWEKLALRKEHAWRIEFSSFL